jgi:hypothetical protein
MAGTALVAEADDPFLVRYAIALAADWSTREVVVDVRQGADARARQLRLRVDAEQQWQIDRESPPDQVTGADDKDALRGLVDIDLGFTPATNTLPIRRLTPEIGEAVDVTAVWVRFPELTIEPLPQRYTRLADRRYRYESAGGAFVAEIEVDDLGLVVAYEGGWQRIAEASAMG